MPHNKKLVAARERSGLAPRRNERFAAVRDQSCRGARGEGQKEARLPSRPVHVDCLRLSPSHAAPYLPSPAA